MLDTVQWTGIHTLCVQCVSAKRNIQDYPIHRVEQPDNLSIDLAVSIIPDFKYPLDSFLIPTLL